MKRLGDTSLSLPKGVEVKRLDGKIEIKGPKGSLEMQLPHGIRTRMEGGKLFIEQDEALVPKALFGLYRALLKNSFIGVTELFEKKLTMIGVGYRAAVTGNKLDLQVGFSHPTAIEIPKTLQVTVDKGTIVIIKGMNKHEVGQFAATVRSMKKPEPYKGKGIRYDGEFVRKKEGKAAKGKA